MCCDLFTVFGAACRVVFVFEDQSEKNGRFPVLSPRIKSDFPFVSLGLNHIVSFLESNLT